MGELIKRGGEGKNPLEPLLLSRTEPEHNLADGSSFVSVFPNQPLQKTYHDTALQHFRSIQKDYQKSPKIFSSRNQLNFVGPRSHILHLCYYFGVPCVPRGVIFMGTAGNYLMNSGALHLSMEHQNKVKPKNHS
ncbi:unnamed protein product [Natator depressus]